MTGSGMGGTAERPDGGTDASDADGSPDTGTVSGVDGGVCSGSGDAGLVAAWATIFGSGDGGPACGDVRCGANQLCARAGCGGDSMAICSTRGADGTCYPGNVMVDCCGSVNGPACLCVPQAQNCVDIPAACSGRTPDCTCVTGDFISNNVCGPYGGYCSNVIEGQVVCYFID